VRDLGQNTPLPKADAQMLAIAEKIVEQQAGDFDPAEFVDRCEDALRAMIEEKKKGHVVKAPQPSNDDGKVIDLMAALKRSLKGGGGEAQQQEAPRRRGSAKRASPKARPKGTRSVA
jgi:DNA end-binding protein Ku